MNYKSIHARVTFSALLNKALKKRDESFYLFKDLEKGDGVIKKLEFERVLVKNLFLDLEDPIYTKFLQTVLDPEDDKFVLLSLLE